MSVTLDANVLVYASNEADPVHGPARDLLRRLAEGPGLVYFFWPTLMAYLRVVTHPAILPRPLTPREAAGNVEQLIGLPHARVQGEADGFWENYRSAGGERTRGNDVPDAHLAALMLQFGVGVIYTRDRDFRRFEGIEARDPFG